MSISRRKLPTAEYMSGTRQVCRQSISILLCPRIKLVSIILSLPSINVSIKYARMYGQRDQSRTPH
jgi:hypothetical protein